MTIQEAIKSGKNFRRPHKKFNGGLNEGWLKSNHDMYQFEREDLIANDWEVEPEKVCDTTIDELAKKIGDMVTDEIKKKLKPSSGGGRK